MRDLGPAWRLRWRDDLPPDVYGFTRWRDKSIYLREGMSFEERRCTIAHEVEHVLRGPASRCDEMREEVQVERSTARLLVPSVLDLADALIWHHGDAELTAEEMWVDMLTLDARLGSLLGIEGKYLRRRLAEVHLLRGDG